MFDESTIKRKRPTPADESTLVHLTFHNGQVPFFTVPALEQHEGILHGISTRFGGISGLSENSIHTPCSDLGTMNLSFSKNDPAERVSENYRRIGASIGFDPANVVATQQTHTDTIRIVKESDRGKGFTHPRDYTNVDGLITDIPELVLTTFFADCVPLLLFDPVRKVIGAAHSGWRGTVAKIGTKMVHKMVEVFHCNPTDIVTAIGPSICQDCYEVSEDVILQVQRSFPASCWTTLFYPTLPGKFHLDLQHACYVNFIEAGVSPRHISKPDICTCCNPQLLYSHRKANGREGNFCSFIMLTKQ